MRGIHLSIFTTALFSLTLAVFPVATQAASAWPASNTATEIASGLSVYNNITTYPYSADNGFEASGINYLSSYGYLAIGDDGDFAVLNGAGSVTNYKYLGGDLEEVATTDTSNVDGKIYLANEGDTAIEEYSLLTQAKTGLNWTLSDLVVSGGDGFEALTYVPEDYAPVDWGSATSGGFFVAASQAEAKLYVYNINRTSSATVTAVTTITNDSFYTDISALYYSTDTRLLYVIFDGQNKIKELNLNGTIVNSYLLPTVGSEEGVVVVPNCAAGNATIAISNDGTPNSVSLYANYPVTCDYDGDSVSALTDCNDNDATISANQTYYRDADEDGLGISTTTTSVCSNSAPTGYVSNSSDSNDSDYDNDGVATSSDCNDNNSSISAYQTYYRDADNDGLGDSANTTSVCSTTAPNGYVSNASDTNDSGATSETPTEPTPEEPVEEDPVVSDPEPEPSDTPTDDAAVEGTATEVDVATTTVVKVRGLKYGRIKVHYSNGTQRRYRFFKASTYQRVKVVRVANVQGIIKNRATGRVLKVNFITGKIIKTIRLAHN